MTEEELRNGVLSLFDVKNDNLVVSRNTLKMTFFSLFINFDSRLVHFLMVASP